MIDLDADTLTLRRRPVLVEQFDGTAPPFAIVQASPVVSRKPRADEPLAVLLQVAMKTPEMFHKPKGMELCSTCGDFKEYPSEFPKDATRKRGYGYVCNKCRAREARIEYAYQAMLEGRTVREYKQRKKAA